MNIWDWTVLTAFFLSGFAARWLYDIFTEPDQEDSAEVNRILGGLRAFVRATSPRDPRILFGPDVHLQRLQYVPRHSAEGRLPWEVRALNEATAEVPILLPIRTPGRILEVEPLPAEKVEVEVFSALAGTGYK